MSGPQTTWSVEGPLPAKTYIVRGERSWVHREGAGEDLVLKPRTTGAGWATVTIREWPGGGSIDIQSDWENYACSWSAIGRNPLREFLLDVEYDYFMGKAHPSRGREFDWDKSIEDLKRQILDHRREGSLEKSEAREMWDDIEHFDNNYETEDSLCSQVYETSWGCEWIEGLGCHVDHRGCRAFWNGPWQVMLEYWRAELAAEALAA